jgi:hypothetical protein
MCRGGVDDRLVNMLPFDMNRFAANAGRVGRIRDGGEGLLGVSFGLLLIFASRVFELALEKGEYREGLGDSHCGNFGADLSLRATPRSTALAARSDPSVGIGIFLYTGALPSAVLFPKIAGPFHIVSRGPTPRDPAIPIDHPGAS